MITILELAQELQTSKTTISRKIKELDMKNRLELLDGKYYLTDEQARQIREAMSRHDTRNAPTRETRNVSERRAERTDTRRDTQFTKDLMQQIKEKDAQIKEKDAQIKELHKLLDQQQQLTMITQQRVLALEDQQQKKQRGIFARLFGTKPAQDPEPPKDQPGQEEQQNPNS